MKGIMVQGTSSDSGKSFIVTALCRVFSDMGYSVCPFKSQNMSNNSYVTADGREMGRAQGVQAEAARVEPQVFMNPILLKPRKDTSSEIVLNGKVFDAPCDKNYYRTFTLGKGLETMREALAHIDKNFDLIIAEGAGSPAEINLNSAEIVNMRVAREADIPVILVTDVDRGGAIASVVGTLELLGEDRNRVKGVIFNKFRGDISLFQDAVRLTEEKTGVKVIGVMPWLSDIIIEGEDVMSINWNKKTESGSCGTLNIGVVKFPRVSNHTDLEAFCFEPDVRIIETDASTHFGDLDAIILPGTKSTVLDMKYLEENGLADKIRKFSAKGGTVYGLCGGYQMLGKKIYDHNFKDNETIAEIDGIGILPVITSFSDTKITQKRTGKIIHPYFKADISVSGYEIHFGETTFTEAKDDFDSLFELDGHKDGAANKNLSAAGSYLHNAFHNDNFRSIWLNNIRRAKGLPERDAADTTSAKEEAYNILAAALIKNIDMKYVAQNIMGLR